MVKTKQTQKKKQKQPISENVDNSTPSNVVVEEPMAGSPTTSSASRAVHPPDDDLPPVIPTPKKKKKSKSGLTTSSTTVVPTTVSEEKTDKMRRKTKKEGTRKKASTSEQSINANAPSSSSNRTKKAREMTLEPTSLALSSDTATSTVSIIDRSDKTKTAVISKKKGARETASATSSLPQSDTATTTTTPLPVLERCAVGSDTGSAKPKIASKKKEGATRKRKKLLLSSVEEESQQVCNHTVVVSDHSPTQRHLPSSTGLKKKHRSPRPYTTPQSQSMETSLQVNKTDKTSVKDRFTHSKHSGHRYTTKRHNRNNTVDTHIDTGSHYESEILPGAVEVRGVDSNDDFVGWEDDHIDLQLEEQSSGWYGNGNSTGTGNDFQIPSLVVAAELSPNEADAAERLVEQIKQEVEAQYLSKHPNPVLANAVMVEPSIKWCGVRRKTCVYFLILLLLVIGATVTGVLVRASNNDDPTTPTRPTLAIDGNLTVDDLQQELEPWIIRTDADLILFENQTSPQALALQWLSTDPISLSYDRLTSTVLERYVLAVLYFSTDGPSWINQTFPFLDEIETCRWNNGLPWENSNALGIFCGGLSIALQEVGLSGTIPWELSLLSDMLMLYLPSNMLRGTIPTEIKKLTNLQDMLVYENFLEGPLPISLPSSLEKFDLSSNLFTGRIPSEWGESLSNVVDLFVENCHLTGPLPTELALMTSLETVWLNDNHLTGTVPSELGQLFNLYYVYLERNELVGPLPSEIGQLTTLQHMWIFNNGLTGTIPSELGQLSNNLLYLALSNNTLVGTLPTEIGQMTALLEFDISNNNLSGTVPTEFAQLPLLYAFWFHNNSMQGSVDSILCVSQEWIVLEGDCLSDDDDNTPAEIPSCSCCTGCCNSRGDICKQFVPLT